MSRQKKTIEEIVESADTNFQVWCRRTELATIVLWYESQGISVKSRSSLGKLILEDFTRMIAKSGFGGVVRETTEAVGILRERGLGELNSQGRGERTLLGKLQLETLRPTGRREITQAEIEESIRRFKEDEKPKIGRTSTENMEIVDDDRIVPPDEQDYSVDNLNKVLSVIPPDIIADEQGELHKGKLDKSNNNKVDGEEVSGDEK
jgi:hypothetical protein